MSDPYSVLGVAKTATDAEIKAAYRKLAMQFHPDQNPDDEGAEAKFKEISAAYDKVKDAEKRRKHDEENNFGATGWAHYRQHGPGNFDFRGGDFHNFEDMMNAFHGRHVPQNRHYNTSCTISMLDAFNGCEVILKVTQPHEREIKVKVPAGVDMGTRIRIPGAGEHVYKDKPAGDLYVQIIVLPDPVFSRQGKNLFSDVYVNAIDAMLGNPIPVRTIDGDEVEISPPAGFQSGWKVRITGRGMPVIASQTRGDHVVMVHLNLPNNLTEEQKKLLEEIKRLSN